VGQYRVPKTFLLTALPLTADDVQPFDEAGVPYVLANRHFGERPTRGALA